MDFLQTPAQIATTAYKRELVLFRSVYGGENFWWREIRDNVLEYGWIGLESKRMLEGGFLQYGRELWILGNKEFASASLGKESLGELSHGFGFANAKHCTERVIWDGESLQQG